MQRRVNHHIQFKHYLYFPTKNILKCDQLRSFNNYNSFQMSALKPHAHMLPGNSHGMAPAQLRAASRLQAIPPARRSSPGGKLVWNIANPLRPLARNLRQPTIKQAPLKTLMENSVLFDEPVDSSPLSNQLNEISFMPLPLVHSKPNNLQIKTGKYQFTFFSCKKYHY